MNYMRRIVTLLPNLLFFSAFFPKRKISNLHIEVGC